MVRYFLLRPMLHSTGFAWDEALFFGIAPVILLWIVFRGTKRDEPFEEEEQ
ncbi:MAG: hypothetical protein Fur0022_22680 [Anaerolineales bacterium]